MSSLEDITSLSREDLVALVAELRRQVTALQRQMGELAAQNQDLRSDVDLNLSLPPYSKV